jgi:hypothetical protein
MERIEPAKAGAFPAAGIGRGRHHAPSPNETGAGRHLFPPMAGGLAGFGRSNRDRSKHRDELLASGAIRRLLIHLGRLRPCGAGRVRASFRSEVRRSAPQNNRFGRAFLR